MASEVCRLIQDLNLNDHSNVVEKDDDLKGGIGASTVYGDVSKFGMPSITEASLKQPCVDDDCNIKRKGGADIVEEEEEEYFLDIAPAEEEEEYSDDEFFFGEPTLKRVEIDENTSEEILREIIMYEQHNYEAHKAYLENQKKYSQINYDDRRPLFPYYSSERIPLYMDSEEDYKLKEEDYKLPSLSEMLEMLKSMEKSGEDDENIEGE